VDPALVLRHRAGVAFVASPDRVALLDLERPAEPASLLVGTAAGIWLAIDGGRSVEGIADRLAEVHGVAPCVVRGDVEAFVAELLARGLLEAA
jgi:hypothetical protein